ncbi:MAG TPA: NAD(P)H-dependent glycerol-3-phosphate dehydrogenase [Gemmatimonadaceae bacterium]|jgi:glycerol-3-phosphate dehydrogenase (NAD(P)+)|nr:NAD(P)H-dependent glycerol-3-phosphate dehydrogenase [Gemmatimonadaceae bacterium]
MRVAVIGAGAWGTALAQLLAHNGHDVVLWAFEQEVVESVNSRHENALYLGGVALPESLRATSDQLDAVRGAGVVVYATPAQLLRGIAAAGAHYLRAGAVLVVASKGIERGSLALMSDVIEHEVGGREIVAISGPSFAAEVARGLPTAVVSASRSTGAARLVQDVFSGSRFRVYSSEDIVGVELGGALKNVMAVATGIHDGVGLGFNSRAALITRGLAEMTRLGVALGANPATFAGLAGLGDLVLTCTGALSRNRSLGVEVGSGRPLADVLQERHTVAEGVDTTVSTVALARREGVEMPIAAMVHRILFDGHTAAAAVKELMARELRAEQD